MKVVMTILVRNEEDIIDQNISFHLDQGVDFFIVTDHKSEDDTPKILKKYQQKGILEVLPQISDTYEQHLWVTGMARRAAEEHGADWVINSDADEFWISEKGSLKEYFQDIPENISLINVRRYDFFYRLYRDASFYEALLFREAEHRWTKCIHRGIKDIEVEAGNHFAHVSDRDLKSLTEEQSLKILHYPVRDHKKYYKKIRDSIPDIVNTKGVAAHVGFHWKKIYEYIERGDFDKFMASQSYSKNAIMDGIRKSQIVMDDSLQQYMLTKRHL